MAEHKKITKITIEEVLRMYETGKIDYYKWNRETGVVEYQVHNAPKQFAELPGYQKGYGSFVNEYPRGGAGSSPR